MNAQGAQLSNIKITDENIKSFDRVARKYGMDYSLKKEVGADPPKYLVFFKAKDVEDVYKRQVLYETPTILASSC